MKSFARNAKAYLPLSLVITLIGVQPAAFAGSALDPYAHIQAPESPAKKKLTNVPSVDNDATASTYVTMPMGGDTSLLPQQPKKPGMFSGLKNPVAGLPNPFKGSGEKKPQAPSYQPSIASKPAPAQKQASPGLMKKSASMISSGFKATGKMASASTSFIPGSGKGKKQQEPKNNIADAPSGSLNEMYVNKAKSNIAKAKEIHKEQKVAEVKLPPSTKEMLGGQNGEQHKVASKKRLIPSMSVPFMKKKPHQETNLAETNSAGGFYQGAMDKKAGHDLKPSQELATTSSAKETPVVASSSSAQPKKKGLMPGMPKLKAPQLASIPFMGGKKKEAAKSAPTQVSQQHQIPVSPGAVSKPTVAEKAPYDPTDPYPDVKPTSIAQHPGAAPPAKKGGMLKMPSVKMPKIGIPGFGGKKAQPQPKREELL